MGSQSYPKHHKLKRRQLIECIFDKGYSGSYGALRWVYRSTTEIESSYQVGFSVSKKRFAKAIDRNRIKRLMRETFRLQQNKIKWKRGTAIMYVYIGKQLPNYKLLHKQMEHSIIYLNNATDL